MRALAFSDPLQGASVYSCRGIIPFTVTTTPPVSGLSVAVVGSGAVAAGTAFSGPNLVTGSTDGSGTFSGYCRPTGVWDPTTPCHLTVSTPAAGYSQSTVDFTLALCS